MWCCVDFAAARPCCPCRCRASPAGQAGHQLRLLASGASIGEMNTVRRHLSAIKGGRLPPPPATRPASSPVAVGCARRPPGRYCLAPLWRCQHLPMVGHRAALCLQRRPGAGRTGKRRGRIHQTERPAPGRCPFAPTYCRAPAGPGSGCPGGATARYHRPYPERCHRGRGPRCGLVLAALALQGPSAASLFSRRVIAAGGETTVTLRSTPQTAGLGGRNVECLLAFALATRGHPRIHALMGDTDAGGWRGRDCRGQQRAAHLGAGFCPGPQPLGPLGRPRCAPVFKPWGAKVWSPGQR